MNDVVSVIDFCRTHQIAISAELDETHGYFSIGFFKGGFDTLTVAFQTEKAVGTMLCKQGSYSSKSIIKKLKEHFHIR